MKNDRLLVIAVLALCVACFAIAIHFLQSRGELREMQTRVANLERETIGRETRLGLLKLVGEKLLICVRFAGN